MIVPWPDDLILDVARRRAVIFIGSGISAQAANAGGRKPRTWIGFLKHGAQSLAGNPDAKVEVEQLVESKDLLTACELLRQELGAVPFRNLVVSEYSTPQYQAAPIHDSIINLDSRIVASPNFDKIYETRVNQQQNGSVRVKRYYDGDVAEAIRSPQRVFIKVHGCVDTPDKMIFTRSDYAKARNVNAAFYDILSALFLTHTFLFLGCGLDDPDVRLLLEDHAFAHEVSRPHYFVLPAGKVSPIAKGAVEESMSVNLLEYDSANEHALLKQAVDELVIAVNEKRVGFTEADW